MPPLTRINLIPPLEMETITANSHWRCYGLQRHQTLRRLARDSCEVVTFGTFGNRKETRSRKLSGLAWLNWNDSLTCQNPETRCVSQFGLWYPFEKWHQRSRSSQSCHYNFCPSVCYHSTCKMIYFPFLEGFHHIQRSSEVFLLAFLGVATAPIWVYHSFAARSIISGKIEWLPDGMVTNLVGNQPIPVQWH